MNSDRLVRPAGPYDLAAVLDLVRRSPGAPHWTDKQFEEVIERSADPSAYRQLFLIEGDSALLGICVVSAVADQGELESIAVAPEQRRKGFAKELCSHALRWAARQGAQHIWLEVRESNHMARALYKSLGFEEAGIRRSYYAEPAEDAVIMRAYGQPATNL